MASTVKLPGTINAPYYLDNDNDDEIVTDILDLGDNDTVTNTDCPIFSKLVLNTELS
jgi:hypothetical protein